MHHALVLVVAKLVPMNNTDDTAAAHNASRQVASAYYLFIAQ